MVKEYVSTADTGLAARLGDLRPGLGFLEDPDDPPPSQSFDAFMPSAAAMGKRCFQTRLVGAILLEQKDEWVVQRARYMTRETRTGMLDPSAIHLPAVAG